MGRGMAYRPESAAARSPFRRVWHQLRARGARRQPPDEADYRAAPLCTGDPDELFALLSAMPGEKVAKIKVGLYEAVRDGMVANLLLEAIPDLRLRLDANRAWTPLKAQQFAKYVNPAYRSRIAFLEEPCKTREDSRALPEKPALLSPG